MKKRQLYQMTVRLDEHLLYSPQADLGGQIYRYSTTLFSAPSETMMFIPDPREPCSTRTMQNSQSVDWIQSTTGPACAHSCNLPLQIRPVSTFTRNLKGFLQSSESNSSRPMTIPPLRRMGLMRRTGIPNVLRQITRERCPSLQDGWKGETLLPLCTM
jgi:hypothetical protein